MKAPTTFSLTEDTATALTTLSNELNVQRSALADLLLRYGLSRVSASKLTEWAKTARRSSSAAEVQTRGSEAVALKALTPEFQTFAQLRAATGLGVGVMHRALHTLSGANRAERDSVIGARDVKGRDVNSRWKLKGSVQS